VSNSNAENACLEFYVATRELLLIEGAWATRDRDVNIGRSLNEATQYQADKERATLRVKNAEFEIKNIGATIYVQGKWLER
jgi:hypothetical protein